MEIQPVLRINHSSDQTAATYYQLGKYHQERGNLELARAAYTQSVALNSRQLEARNALATVYSQQGRLDDAKALLLQLVADFPAVAHPYNNLGYVYYLQGNFDAAITTLQHALALDSADERSRNNLKMAQAAVATQGELAAITHALAPPATETKSVLADATNVPRTQADAAATGTAPLPPRQPNLEPGKAPIADATVAPPPAPPLMNPPSLPQTRMELVRVVPNVYELRPRAAIAPVIAQRQLGQASPASAARAPLIATATKTSRVEVANGNGVTGMARRIGRVLGQRGIAVSRLTNALPYHQQNTKIQYRFGYEQAATALKNALNGHAVIVPANHLSARSDVRLVLGKDAIAYMALIEGPASDSRLALNGESN